jgi:hypothetical protein
MRESVLALLDAMTGECVSSTAGLVDVMERWEPRLTRHGQQVSAPGGEALASREGVQSALGEAEEALAALVATCEQHLRAVKALQAAASHGTEGRGPE